MDYVELLVLSLHNFVDLLSKIKNKFCLRIEHLVVLTSLNIWYIGLIQDQNLRNKSSIDN